MKKHILLALLFALSLTASYASQEYNNLPDEQQHSRKRQREDGEIRSNKWHKVDEQEEELQLQLLIEKIEQLLKNKY